MTESNPQLLLLFERIAKIASVIVMLVSLCVLAGWAFDISFLKSIHPSFVTMKANTAIAFLLLGLALGIQSFSGKSSWAKRLTRGCASIAFLIGILTLCEDIFGWKLPVDQLFFKEVEGAVGTPHPGRMAPITALNFTLLGLAMFLISGRSSKNAWRIYLPIISAALLSLLAFVGYLYHVPSLYGIQSYTKTAVHAAVLFLILCQGMLFTGPKVGFMRVLASDSVGGILARRLMPACFIVPIFLGGLRLLGEEAGFYDSSFGLSILVIATIAVFLLLILITSSYLHRIDLGRRGMETHFRSIVESSLTPMLIIDPEGHIILTNESAVLLFGYQRAELLGLGIENLIPPGYHQSEKNSGKNQDLRSAGAANAIEAVKKDGGKIPIEMALNPVETTEGSFALVTIIDISVRRNFENELKEEKDLFARMNRSMVERETRMIELKKQVNELLAAQGKPPFYVIPAAIKDPGQ